MYFNPFCIGFNSKACKPGVLNHLNARRVGPDGYLSDAGMVDKNRAFLAYFLGIFV